MKTVNIINLCIGVNDRDQFCLGLFNRDNQCLYEILIRGKNISLSKNPMPLIPWAFLSRILFNDYLKIGDKYPSIEIGENLIKEWIKKIKTNEINSALKEIEDYGPSFIIPNNEAGQLIKKELLFSLLSDYSCIIQSEKDLNNEPSLEK